MSKLPKRLLSGLLCFVMVLSMVVLPNFTVSAAEPGNAIDAIPDAHKVIVGDYSTFAADFSDKDCIIEYVDDAEAHGGKAVHSQAVWGRLRVHHYIDSGVIEAGILYLDQLAAKEGYNVYEFTYDIPETAEKSSHFNLLDNWQLNAVPFGNSVFANFKGKTVKLYFSIKVEANENAAYGSYDVYIDRVVAASVCEYSDFVDDGNGNFVATCDVCGAQYKKGAIDFVPKEHLVSNYGCDSFAHVGDPVVDEDAYGDKAAPFDLKSLNLSVTHYNPDIGGSHGVAVLGAGELKVNAGYNTYKMTYQIPEGTTKNGYLFLTGDWVPQQTTVAYAMADYAGKTVDIYLSLKITGNADDGYVMWLDRIAMATHCDPCTRATCSVCGAATQHAFNNYVSDGNATNLSNGTKTATCENGCGAKDTVEIGGPTMIPSGFVGVTADDLAVFTAQTDIKAAYVGHFKDGYENDPEAYGGKAAVLVYDGRDEKAQGAMRGGLKMWMSGTDAGVGTIGVNSFVADGQYHFYKIEDRTYNATETVMYMSDCWGLQVQNLASKLVDGEKYDIYISMKVTGDLTFAEPTAKYYFDRVIFVASDLTTCAEHEFFAIEAAEPSCKPGNTAGETCSVCGYTTTEEIPAVAEHVFTTVAGGVNGPSFMSCDNGCGTKKFVEDTFAAQMAAVVGSAHIVADRSAANGGLETVIPSIHTVVDDPDAYGGKAMATYPDSPDAVYDNFLNGITFEATKGGLAADGVPVSELIADGEYHTYKTRITYCAASGYMFMFYTWAFKVMPDASALNGKGDLDIYFSLKIEGDPTGADRSERLVFYVDRIIIATPHDMVETEGVAPSCKPGMTGGKACTICTYKEDAQEIPATGEHSFTQYSGGVDGPMVAYCDAGCGTAKFIEESLAGSFDAVLNSSHRLAVRVAATDFVTKAPGLHDLVDDADAYGGRAMVTYATDDKTAGVDVDVRTRCARSKAIISKDSLIADGEYHIYKSSMTVTSDANIAGIMMFATWGFQVWDMEGWNANMGAYAGQTIDVYVSMKVTGDVSVKNGGGAYYVDRVVFATSHDMVRVGGVTPTCKPGLTVGDKCSICGYSTQKEIPAVSEHSFTNYVSSANGPDFAVCDNGCGTIKAVENFRDELDSVLESDDRLAVRVAATDFVTLSPGLHVLVDDADAYGGRAMVTYTTDNKTAGVDVDVRTRCGRSKAIISKDVLVADGEYHIYKSSMTVTSDADIGGIMMFATWGFQVWDKEGWNANMGDYAGQTIDVYVSMKVVGDVSVKDGDGAYYVDRVVFAKQAHEHSYEESIITAPTCTEDGLATYTCTICGDTYEDAVPATGHSIEYVAAVIPANCQETGHDEYWYCAACDAYFGDAEASWQMNPAWMYYTGEHVRPEGAIPCVVVSCVVCGEDSYGEMCDRGDAPVCQDAPCVNCGETCFGWGCNYNTGDEEVQLPLCQPGTCVYCGTEYEKLFDCENGSWAPCSVDGECAYGCGKQFPATGEHQVDDPCAGGLCWLCWEEIEPTHSWVDATCETPKTCSVCNVTEGEALGHNYVDNTCTNCGDVLAPAGITVSGAITSFGDEAGEVTVKLYSGDTEIVAVTSIDGTYSLLAPAAGTYTLTVAKANHATRIYEITVADAAVTQDVKIHLLGDIDGNGLLNVLDVNRANAHNKGKKLLTGYELQCIDIDGNGLINVLDVNRMNAHNKGKKPLW